MHNSDNMVNATNTRNILGTTGVLACAVMLSACFGSDAVHGEIDVDLRSETLLAGDLESANGTYGAGCTNRTGAWSVEIEGGATLDNAVLSVVLNNNACVLTLTGLRTTGGLLLAAPAIALTTSYKVAASAFEDEFFGNAKMDSVSFAGDFILTVLYSDDPSLATDDNTASFAVAESSAAGDSVTVPDYTIDPDNLVIVTDNAQVVTGATGSVTLTAGLQVGQTYVVVDAAGLNTYDELDDAYKLGIPAAIGASIPAADFTLVGEDLDTLTQRTVIIANTESGVASYQAFEITFNKSVVVP